MNDILLTKNAVELKSLLARREISAVELTETCLASITSDPHNAFITVLEEKALSRARRLDQHAISGATLGPLHGIPVAVKDLADFVAGVPNTFGARPLANYVPRATSLHIERIEAAGGVVIGKTNTPEFGHMGVTDNLLVGATSNPLAPNYNAGGSSGGAAAAVAGHLVPLAQGSDGGGSIRIPAAFCNVVGFKPTFGMIADPSRPNAFLAGAPFQHLGSLGRSVEDAELLTGVLAGPSPRDPFSTPAPPRRPPRTWRSARVAYWPTFGNFPVDPDVATVVADAVLTLEELGAQVELVESSLGGSPQDLAAAWLRMSGAILSQVYWSLHNEGFDLLSAGAEDLPPRLRQLVSTARRLRLDDIQRDQILRTRVLDAIEDTLDGADLIVTPVNCIAGILNQPHGRTVGPSSVAGHAVDPLIGWTMAFPVNFTGHPAIALPAGRTVSGVPVGLQLIAGRFEDAQLIRWARDFEMARPWRQWYSPPVNQMG